MPPKLAVCEQCGGDFFYESTSKRTKTCSKDCASALKLASRGKISNAPLREAFLRLEAHNEVTAEEMASRLGWMHSKRHEKRPDGTRVLRSLGLREQRCGKTKTSIVIQHIGYERACALAVAMGLDPVDVDL